MIVVTGGAGFIGSAIVAELNHRGEQNILVVDVLDHERKERNLTPLKYRELVGIEDFRLELNSGKLKERSIRGIIHMGACSSTMETNWDYLQDNNVNYTKEIIRWCVENEARCVYASSAATYGDGTQGFSDDHALFDNLVPLNLYGKSKLIVDLWARDEGLLNRVAGVRYFNVFGPNEWHKGVMRSVIAKKFPDVKDDRKITLFKSYHPSYSDGAPERDFVYVKDAVNMTLWLFDHPEANGVINIQD